MPPTPSGAPALSPPPNLIDQTVIQFEILKDRIFTDSGLPPEALHIYAGVIIMLIARMIWRSRGGWLFAWLVTVAAALGGEWLDMRSNLTPGSIADGTDHWYDIWNTLAVPTALMLLGPWLNPRQRAKAAPAEPAADPEPSGDEREHALEQR